MRQERAVRLLNIPLYLFVSRVSPSCVCMFNPQGRESINGQGMKRYRVCDVQFCLSRSLSAVAGSSDGCDVTFLDAVAAFAFSPFAALWLRLHATSVNPRAALGSRVLLPHYYTYPDFLSLSLSLMLLLRFKSKKETALLIFFFFFFCLICFELINHLW